MTTLDRNKRLNFLNRELFDELNSQACASSRRRAHRNLHEHADEPVQRLLIALQTDTFIRVHRHYRQQKRELLVVIQGAFDCLIFSESGQLLERHRLGHQSELRGLEIPPDAWHSILCTQPDTIVLEIKQGPYIPSLAAEFAPWCPQEGGTASKGFLQWMRGANCGDDYLA